MSRLIVAFWLSLAITISLWIWYGYEGFAYAQKGIVIGGFS